MLAVLPAELWSHIFQFVERGDRVAWLRVNRTANDLALKVMNFSDIDILTWSARRGIIIIAHIISHHLMYLKRMNPDTSKRVSSNGGKTSAQFNRKNER